MFNKIIQGSAAISSTFTSRLTTMSSHAVRIASASGAVTDLPENLAILAKDAEIDFIVGDWMSEYNMTIRGASKVSTSPSDDDTANYEHQFVESLEPALEHLAHRKIRLAVNAGASDTERLHQKLVAMIKAKGFDLTVAWIEGDEAMGIVDASRKSGQPLRNITTGQLLADWEFEPIYAQCYLGCWGIVEALNAGADIVVCGRVADAAPTMAAAAFWHRWTRDQFSELAHSLIAGHLMECSYYVTGGNFTGFKDLPQGISPLLHLPIAHVFGNGTFEVRRHEIPGRSGKVSRDTCRSQLLYELQGKRYYNSDVVAIVDKIVIEERAENVVFVHNVGFEKPPPTTKVGITARGGYQAEAHYFLTGLDITEKASLLERQLRTILDKGQFSLLKFTTTGVCQDNPCSQDAATVDFRIFAQARHEEALSPAKFLRPIFNIVMSTYPGATFAVDARQAAPKPYLEYFVTIIEQSEIKHFAHLPSKDTKIAIPSPADTTPYRYEQDVEESQVTFTSLAYGPTVNAPLGFVVHARSGDKGSDCNVGFYVRHEDEYDWLRSLLSIDMVRHLLQNDYNGGRIERFELPNIQAVHFLLKDHLDRGVAASSTYDVLGKNLAEYLRAKHVQIPVKFLNRGRI
ncbi:hypothetical protein BDZ85DRAFT_232446 [Elsinoe ampelina]|uniref:DUF1446-domain-containing protein n=1 Tax=Elsinoe ampelina TaxID=302913 RepID=A0A6A6GKN8_9PEZI|nr:hypothetical protein BDZ85DRAFT_232446 [Elsinoe ampelina]